MGARTRAVSVPRAAATMLAAVTFGCSAPARPAVRTGSSAPQTCAQAAAAATPGGKRGTLEAYRDVERQCGSLEQLAELGAYDGEILRFDCVPADILALGAATRQRGTEVPHPPPDLLETAICGQFNRECTDYDEIRRDQAELVRRPTVANAGLFVNHNARLEACNQRYSKR